MIIQWYTFVKRHYLTHILTKAKITTMDTEKCSALLLAIELKSLSGAAEKLGYTPSGMSRLLHSMEKELGFPLLQRRRSGVYPTPECQQLLPALRRLADDGETLAQTAAQIRDLEVGSITVAATLPSFYPPLGSVIQEFRKQYPGITVTMLPGGGYATVLCDMVAEHTLDLCISSYRPGDFQWFPLLEDCLVAWVPQDSPYARQERIDARQLLADKYIALGTTAETDTSRYFAELGVSPNVIFSARESYGVYCMVEAGLGVSINNRITAARWSGQVVQRPLIPQRDIQIGIIAPSRQDISPAAAKFLEFFRSRITSHFIRSLEGFPE